MSMFDKETQLKNAEDFDAAQGFTLFSGEYMGMADSAEYGQRPKAKVKAGPVDSAENAAKEYVVFGVMAEQIGRIANGDLPAKCKIGTDGRANVLQKISD